MVTSLGLPLLIVNGKFQSLYSMTVEDLEIFIPYLVKCSVNRAGAQLINEVPEWWPSVIQFQFPLQKPLGLSQISYQKQLTSLVCICYWYHNAQYLLPFSAKIAENPNSVFLRNNDDNTTSIFYAHNTVQIMKFSNENKNYDAVPKKKEKHVRRCLLPSLPKKKISIPDIYLCENCDAEFSSHSDMQEHEKHCYEIIIDDDYNDDSDKNEGSNSDSSEEIEILAHIKPSKQAIPNKNNLMNYLGLQQTSDQNVLTMVKPKAYNHDSHSKRWVKINRCLHKNVNIEFSSSFGRKISEHCVKRDLINKIEKKISLYESYCGTSIKTSRELRELTDFRVSFKKGKKTKWDHHYSFGKRQRIIHYNRLKTGLNERSQRLLKQCKKLRIVLNRINFPS